MQGLEKIANLKPYKGRGDEFTSKQGFRVIDQSYNASPTSMKNALGKFSKTKIKGSKVALLGDMLELGKDAKKYHKELAADINNIDICLTCGSLMEELYNELKQSKNIEAKHFTSCEQASEYILKSLKKEDKLLVKGSHGSNLWKLVENLRAK